MKHKIILYYKYADIENPTEFMDSQRALCEKLGLKGRIIIAKEGLNGTLEGLAADIDKYVADLKNDSRFSNIDIKESEGTGDAFPKLSIKVRDEIVTLKLGAGDFSPNEITGKYITAEELHELFESGEEFYIIDMRNDYEHAVGHFEDSVLPSMRRFRELPQKLEEIAHLKNKKIVTVCTGGVRCEKASGFLLQNGFTDVSQLQNGIVTYMEKYPNENFLGELYVFDQRIIMGFNMDSHEHKVIAKCELCGKTSNNYINCVDDVCHKHFICCEDCLDDRGHAYCSGVHENISVENKK